MTAAKVAAQQQAVNSVRKTGLRRVASDDESQLVTAIPERGNNSSVLKRGTRRQ
jgi:hypothetical protein